jgi:hypothetical protein
MAEVPMHQCSKSVFISLTSWAQSEAKKLHENIPSISFQNILVMAVLVPKTATKNYKVVNSTNLADWITPSLVWTSCKHSFSQLLVNFIMKNNYKVINIIYAKYPFLDYLPSWFRKFLVF